MTQEPFLQQLHSGVAHNLHVTLPLKELVENKQWKTNVKSVIKDLELVNEIGESQVDLLEVSLLFVIMSFAINYFYYVFTKVTNTYWS